MDPRGTVREPATLTGHRGASLAWPNASSRQRIDCSDGSGVETCNSHELPDEQREHDELDHRAQRRPAIRIPNCSAVEDSGVNEGVGPQSARHTRRPRRSSGRPAGEPAPTRESVTRHVDRHDACDDERGRPDLLFVRSAAPGLNPWSMSPRSVQARRALRQRPVRRSRRVLGPGEHNDRTSRIAWTPAWPMNFQKTRTRRERIHVRRGVGFESGLPSSGPSDPGVTLPGPSRW
jgi:hypothetical protein